MKILYVITSLNTGGAEKLMLDIIPRLNKKGFNVDLAIFDGTETTFFKLLQQQNVNIIALSKGKNVYDLRLIIKLRKILSNYDIIHTHNYSPQLFAAIAALGKKTRLVTTEHNTSNRRRNKPLLFPLDKWMYRQYEKIICISDKAEVNLRDYLKRSDQHICTIYNGVDIRKFQTAEPDFEIIKEYNGLKTVSMVAGFRLQKDQKTLIRSLTHLPKEYHVLFVGDGEYRTECQEYAKKIGVENRCHFLGIRNNIPQILKSSDVVVLSSHYEGLSLSSVEGLACGKPFIASDVDGLKEVVESYGVLFPHENDVELAFAIKRCCEDVPYRDEIIKSCLSRASDFDIEKMVHNYSDLYKNL